MSRNRYHLMKNFRGRRRQRGSMLIIAIFIIVVMVLLVAAVQEVFNQSSKAITYEVFGTRALSAANSGSELALQKIFYLNGQTPLNWVGDNATVALDLSQTTAFHGCTVAVNIARFTIAATGYTHYRIDSTASCIAGGFTTVRTISIEGRER